MRASNKLVKNEKKMVKAKFSITINSALLCYAPFLTGETTIFLSPVTNDKINEKST